jgi:hypothetical protein
MVTVTAYRQFRNFVPAFYSTFKSRDIFTDFAIDGVTYAKVIRLTYASRDGSIWRASFGGADLKFTQKLLARPVISGTVQGFLQEKQTIPGITKPIPVPAIFGKDWGAKGLSLPLKTLYNTFTNSSTLRQPLLDAAVFAGNDTIIMSPFDDPASDAQFVRGFAGNDNIFGGKGNDRLNGNGGDDNLFGGLGDDDLLGDIGKDTLQGDDGADSFLYKAVNNSPAGVGRDVITDFDPSEGDIINLGSIDANPSTPDDDKFKYIGSDEFSGSASKGQVRFTTIGSDGLLAINLAGGADPLAPEMEILLQGVTSLPSLDPANPFLKL